MVAEAIEFDGDTLAAIDYCYERGWTDGLPVVPPEARRIEAMLAFEGRPAETVVCTHPATGRECTLAAAAANAVMAGCLPEYFPVLVAALEALDTPAFTFHGSTASTGGSAPLLIVSGPVVNEIGMNSGAGCFGPGNRANATLGRALRLIIMNVFGMIPGVTDQSTQGHPGKYSFCIAERAEVSPWEPLNVALGYPEDVSVAVVYAGAGFNNVENHGGNSPEAILDCVADSMANLGCISPGQSVVVFSPEHAATIGAAGWSRQRVCEYLHEHARRETSLLKRVGKYINRAKNNGERGNSVHRGLGPEDILITVAGGDAGGHSAFIPAWSRDRGSIMQSRPIGVCIDC